jgi:NAD(P)H dehydrogenase (quinone)
MTTVSIIYHSGFGYTAKTAESVAAGARSVEGVTIKLFPITES